MRRVRMSGTRADMEISCPTCDLVSVDELEVVDTNRVTAMQCERCSSDFFFLLFDCDPCGQENSLSWQCQPTEKYLQGLLCKRCRMPRLAGSVDADE